MIIDNQKENVLKAKKMFPNMPLFVMELWVRNAIEAGNEGDLEVLIQDPIAMDINGGFNWNSSAQGGHFWDCMCGPVGIHYCGFTLSRIEAEVSEYLDFQHIH